MAPDLGVVDQELAGVIDQETGDVTKKSRVSSPAVIRSKFSLYRREDQKRNRNRARIDGMFDGEPPQSEQLLRSLGRGAEFNVNLGTSQRALDLAMSGYIDLANSVQTLMNVESGVGEQAERDYVNTRIAVHATRAIRSWPGFHSSYLELVSEFIKHGVGIAMFADSVDFRFLVSGLQNFLIPQQTRSSPEYVDSAYYREQIPVVQLYSYIEDEKAAEAMGWNVEAVKRSLMSAASTTKKNFSESNWEELQREIKNQDDNTTSMYPNVPLVWAWVKEADGTYSRFCILESTRASGVTPGGEKVDPLEAFLYKDEFSVERPEEAFIPFTYGVGNNGTYHSIRGLGQRIFPLVQAYNRMYCTAMNGAMLSSGVMVQPTSAQSRANMQFQQHGPFMVVPENVQFVEKAFPNLSQSVLPFVQDLTQQLGENMDFYSTAGAAGGSPYRNRLQIEAELASATQLTSANLSLFYSSWTLLVREMTKRLIEGPKSNPVVREFYRRCEEDGVPEVIVKSIDYSRTVAVRAVGAGNASSRVAKLERLQQYAPQYDETGRHNLLYDLTAAELDHEAAERYVPALPGERPTTDFAIASMQNAQLVQGIVLPVLSTELHGEHLRAHLPRIQEITTGIDAGQIDAMQVLQGLINLHDHAAEHTVMLAADPLSQAVVAEANAILQRSNEQILNFTRKAQAEAQNAAQAGEQQEGPSEEDLKQMEQMQKMRHEQTMAQLKVQEQELKLQITQAQGAQKIALADAKAAGNVVAQANTFPR